MIQINWAIGYVRESQQDRRSKSEIGESTSIISQIKRVKEEAEKDGFKLVEIFKDINRSARNIRRKGIIELKEFLIKHKRQIKRIYIKDYSRLGRGKTLSYFLTIFEQELNYKQWNKILFFYDEDHDESRINKVNETIRLIKEGISNETVELAHNETEKKHKQKQAEQLPYIKPPIGYRYCTDKASKYFKNWMVDKYKSKIVRQVWDLALQGIDYRKICRDLKLEYRQYHRIIKNKCYLGLIEYKKKDEDEVILYKGSHKPLISFDDWLKIHHEDKDNEVIKTLLKKEKAQQETPARLEGG